MNRAALHERLRRMRFESLLDRHRGGKITQAEAAEMLGISERTFRRWTNRFEEEGEAGLHDRRVGGPSPKRAPAEEVERMLGLFKDKYADFTVKHFHEQLRKRHNYKLGYTVTKVHLHRAGLVRPAPKPGDRRRKANAVLRSSNLRSTASCSVCDAVARLARGACEKGWTPAENVRILFSCMRMTRAGIGGCAWATWPRMK
jgi:transposase